MKYWKRVIAPILAASVIILYYIAIAGFLAVTANVPEAVRILLLLMPLLLAAAMFG